MLCAPPGIRTVRPSSASVSQIWQEGGKCGRHGRRDRADSSSSSLARVGKAAETPPRRWTWHVEQAICTFALALERLAVRLGEVEQALAGRTSDILDLVAVRRNETHQGHAASPSWPAAASSIKVSARTSSSSFVLRPKPSRMLERAWRSSRPSADKTWLGRPEPLAQAEPAEKAISRSSEIKERNRCPFAGD